MKYVAPKMVAVSRKVVNTNGAGSGLNGVG